MSHEATTALQVRGEETMTRGQRRAERRRSGQRLGWLSAPMVIVYAFLYLPIVVVVAMSFNASRNLFVWKGFSFEWYGSLFRNQDMMEGLRNTLIVASATTVIACTLGTLLAIGIHRYTRGGGLRAFAIAPAVLPDLLLGIGLLTLFSLISFSLGLHTVIIAHSVFASAFVTAIVLSRIVGLDPSLEEASRDLGASAARTFFKVTLPQLAPAIVAGGLLAFTLSLDEFVIAYFTAAPTTPTLPIAIYSTVRFGITPDVNALATLLLLVTLVTVLVASRLMKSLLQKKER